MLVIADASGETELWLFHRRQRPGTAGHEADRAGRRRLTTDGNGSRITTAAPLAARGNQQRLVDERKDQPDRLRQHRLVPDTPPAAGAQHHAQRRPAVVIVRGRPVFPLPARYPTCVLVLAGRQGFGSSATTFEATNGRGDRNMGRSSDKALAHLRDRA